MPTANGRDTTLDAALGHLTDRIRQAAKTLRELAIKDNELASHTKTIAQQNDIIKQLEARIDAKEKAYLKLWEERFAAKSERYIEDPDQLRIEFGDTADAADAAAGLAEAIEEADLISAHRRKKRKKRDESLPEHLPRKTIIVEPDDTEKICGTHGEKTLLPESMWDVREKLIYIPGTLTVEVRRYLLMPGSRPTLSTNGPSTKFEEPKEKQNTCSSKNAHP